MFLLIFYKVIYRFEKKLGIQIKIIILICKIFMFFEKKGVSKF